MIRDQFVKQQTKQKLTPKQMSEIRNLGERGYYIKRINNLLNFNKMMNFTVIVFSIMLVLLIFPLVLGIIAEGFSGKVLLMFLMFIAFVLIIVLWLTVFFPRNKKTIQKCNELLEELRQKEIEKQKQIYKMINK